MFFSDEESCGCWFRKDDSSCKAGIRSCLRPSPGKCIGSGGAVRPGNQFPVPTPDGCRVFGECTGRYRPHTAGSAGSVLPEGVLLLLYSSRLPPMIFSYGSALAAIQIQLSILRSQCSSGSLRRNHMHGPLFHNFFCHYNLPPCKMQRQGFFGRKVA